MCTKNICYECKSLYQREYRKKNKDKIRKYKSKTEIKKRHTELEKIRRKGKPEEGILARARTRAKKFGLPFNITSEDIVIPDVCPIFGLKLEIADKIFNDSSPSLDRIIPELGYVKENVIVISNRANVLKRDAKIDELEKIVMFYKKLDK
jgi:hypothetical protein